MTKSELYAPESIARAPMMAPEVTGLDKALRDYEALRLMDRAEIAAILRWRP